MTLLTFHSKYVSQSTTPVSTTSSSYQDDTQASQTFTLVESKTVFALYIGSGNDASSNYQTGIKSTVSVDGTEYCEMCQSPGTANYAVRNSCFWIGTLTAGSHTIKGRFCSITNGQTVTLDNHSLLIYVFNGDEFSYVVNSTTRTTATTSYGDLVGCTATFTPSASCKSLTLAAITNDNGSTVPVAGYRMLLSIAGSVYTEPEVDQSPFGANYPISIMTHFNGTHTAVSTTNKVRWAACAGTDTCTVNRSVLGILLFDESVTIDRVNSSTAVTTTSLTLTNDANGAVSETTTEPMELLALASATTLYNTASSGHGGRYGLYLEGADRCFSTKSPYNATQASATYTAHGISIPAAGSHTVQGRYAANYADTTERIGKRVLFGIYFPRRTPLTFKEKYIVQSGSTQAATTNSLVDDSYGSQTFTLTASQTVMAMYIANSNYGDTNNVGGFQNAINVDGTDYCLMHDSGYAANYPMRNACFWVGTLQPGSHTIKGRVASNVASTNTSITNRTLLIYVFDGNAYNYFEGTTQVTLTNDTYVDDTVTDLVYTTSGASKALVLYGVTNNHGTSESYLGKKIVVNINAVDYTECQAMESSYSTTGYTDSVTTAFATSLAASTYAFTGRVATTYGTYTTYVDNRAFAVLFFNDSTLLDADSSTTSQNTTSTSLIDDPDISVTRTDAGELLAIYMGCKRYLTNSSITGNQYGLEIDGVDVANSRTSQAYTGSAHSCVVAYGKSVYSGSHTVTGRYASNASPNAVYITDRYLVSLWFDTTPVTKDFSASNDLLLSEAFSSTSDISLSKAFSSLNDVLFSKTFSASVDIALFKIFSALNDVSVSKYFAGSSDLFLSKAFNSIQDIGVESEFSSTSTIFLRKVFFNISDILVNKVFSATADIDIKKFFSNLNDILIENEYPTSNDLLLSNGYSSSQDIDINKQFLASNDVLVSKVFSNINDVLLQKAFSSLNVVFAGNSFESANDILLSTDFEAENDVQLIKDFSAINGIRVAGSFSSDNSIFLHTTFEAVNDVLTNAYFSSTNAILTSMLQKYFSSTNNIYVNKSFSGDSSILEYFDNLFSTINDILVSSQVAASNDVYANLYNSSSNDIQISTTKSSAHDIIVWDQFLSTNRIVLGSKFFTSTNRIFLFTEFDTSNDIQILKELESTNSIIHIHFDPVYPLSVVVSKDKRLILITDVTKEVLVYCAKRTVSVNSSEDRTVLVDNPTRRTTVW